MIRVEMWLYNEFERQIFNEMATIVEKSRRAQQEANHGNAAPGQRVQDNPPPAEPPVPPPSPEGDDKIAGHISPEGAVKYEGKSNVKVEMKYETVEAAMHAAVKALGTPKTREIIAEFLPEGKRVKDLEPAVWPELVKRLEAGK